MTERPDWGLRIAFMLAGINIMLDCLNFAFDPADQYLPGWMFAVFAACWAYAAVRVISRGVK